MQNLQWAIDMPGLGILPTIRLTYRFGDLSYDLVNMQEYEKERRTAEPQSPPCVTEMSGGQKEVSQHRGTRQTIFVVSESKHQFMSNLDEA